MSLTVYIDMGDYTKEYAESMLALVSYEIGERAAKKVRVDKGTLKNSIQEKKVGSYKWIVLAQASYAKAQEYGLAPFGKPGYSFTPYMRPAVKETEANINKIAKQAQKVAKRNSMVNRRYD